MLGEPAFGVDAIVEYAGGVTAGRGEPLESGTMRCPNRSGSADISPTTQDYDDRPRPAPEPKKYAPVTFQNCGSKSLGDARTSAGERATTNGFRVWDFGPYPRARCWDCIEKRCRPGGRPPCRSWLAAAGLGSVEAS